MGEAMEDQVHDYEIDFENRNTFLHISVRSTTPVLTRSQSWTPSSSSKDSSSESSAFPQGWLASTAVLPATQEQLMHRVFNITSGTSSSSKPSCSDLTDSNTTDKAIVTSGSDEKRQTAAQEPPRAEGAPTSSGSWHAVTATLPLYDLPSRGSIGHLEGRCQPCRFINLPDGCRNGYECTFCHDDHEVATGKTHRPSKGVRSGYKRSVNQIIESDLPEEQKLEAYKRLAERSPYMRCLIKAVVPNIDEIVRSEAPEFERECVPRTPGLQPSPKEAGYFSESKISL